MLVTLLPVSVTGFGEILKGLIKFNCKMFKLVLNFFLLGKFSGLQMAEYYEILLSYGHTVTSPSSWHNN